MSFYIYAVPPCSSFSHHMNQVLAFLSSHLHGSAVKDWAIIRLQESWHNFELNIIARNNQSSDVREEHNVQKWMIKTQLNIFLMLVRRIIGEDFHSLPTILCLRVSMSRSSHKLRDLDEESASLFTLSVLLLAPLIVLKFLAKVKWIS